MSAWTGKRSAARGPKATRGARVSGALASGRIVLARVARGSVAPGSAADGARGPGRNRRPGLPPGWAAIARKAKANREHVEKGTAAKAARSRVALSAKSAVKALGAFRDSRPESKKRVGDHGKRVGVTFVTFWGGMTLAAILSTSGTLMVLRTLGRKHVRAVATSQISEIHATSPMQEGASDAQVASPSPNGDAAVEQVATASEPAAKESDSPKEGEPQPASASTNGDQVSERPSAQVTSAAASAAQSARAKMSELFRKLTGSRSGSVAGEEAKSDARSTERTTDRSDEEAGSARASSPSEESSRAVATSSLRSREKRRRRSGQRRSMGAIASAQSAARAEAESTETSKEASLEERARDTRATDSSVDSAGEGSTEGGGAGGTESGEWLDPFEIR